jgi:hypothetical protein
MKLYPLISNSFYLVSPETGWFSFISAMNFDGNIPNWVSKHLEKYPGVLNPVLNAILLPTLIRSNIRSFSQIGKVSPEVIISAVRNGFTCSNGR